MELTPSLYRVDRGPISSNTCVYIQIMNRRAGVLRRGIRDSIPPPSEQDEVPMGNEHLVALYWLFSQRSG